jgi:hypothetical protein
MKSITPTISGLASSLFLNVGLSKLAEKLDPVTGSKSEIVQRSAGALPVQACIPSAFTPRSN